MQAVRARRGSGPGFATSTRGLCAEAARLSGADARRRARSLPAQRSSPPPAFQPLSLLPRVLYTPRGKDRRRQGNRSSGEPGREAHRVLGAQPPEDEWGRN